jgi:hypothetical protein
MAIDLCQFMQMKVVLFEDLGDGFAGIGCNWRIHFYLFFSLLSEGEFLIACCGILFKCVFLSFFLRLFEFSLRYIIQTYCVFTN